MENPNSAPPSSFIDSRVQKVTHDFAAMSRFCADAACRGTFLFFGSARALSQEAHARKVSQLESRAAEVTDDVEKEKITSQLAVLHSQLWSATYWEKTRELARLLTVWAKSEEGRTVGYRVRSHTGTPAGGDQPLVVCTGGGPGFMEAANVGAFADAAGRSMGIAVELPFESRLNDFLSPELGITCDTFFTRKYWEVFLAKAMIVCPGGVGTCDEMFEVLTLMQCRKMPKIPVVLLGEEFWRTAVNLRFLAARGMMTNDEIDELLITDDPAEASAFIVAHLRAEASQTPGPPLYFSQ